jgi:hypothetical protein
MLNEGKQLWYLDNQFYTVSAVTFGSQFYFGSGSKSGSGKIIPDPYPLRHNTVYLT